MTRQFNMVGPCQRPLHHLIDPQDRLPHYRQLVETGAYFWVHGPRQTGKTTAMTVLATDLRKTKGYAVVHVSAAAARSPSRVHPSAPEQAETGAIAEEAFLSALREAAQDLPQELQPPLWGYEAAGQRIRSALTAWAIACPRPLVLFIDDGDTLGPEALAVLLRQIRDGFSHRPQRFPHAIALISTQSLEQLPLPPFPSASDEGSAIARDAMAPGRFFQPIAAESIAIQAFTADDIANLYQAHTNEGGQLFTLEAVDRAFDLTQGQPWLVNAIAHHVVTATEGPIESHHIDGAAERLVAQGTIHIDQLEPRLHEPAMAALLEAVLLGLPIPSIPRPVGENAIAIGLCRRDAMGGLVIANPLYRRIMLNTLAKPLAASLSSIPIHGPSFDHGQANSVEMQLHQLLAYWQQYGDGLLKDHCYPHLAPYLAIATIIQRMAYPTRLQPDYDLQANAVQIVWPLGKSPPRTIVMVGMVWRDHAPDPWDAGLQRLDQAWNPHSATEAWLILMDQRRDRAPGWERTTLDTAQTPAGRSVSVLRG